MVLQNPTRSIVLMAGLLAMVVSGLVGCAEGPFWRLNYLNPWMVRQWQEEDAMIAELANRRGTIDQIAQQAKRMEATEAEQAVQYLREAVLEDDVLLVRVDATRTLGMLPTPRATEALIGFLNDPDPEIRLAATETLAERAAEEAIPPLRSVLENESDMDIRLAATRALAEFKGDRDAIEALAIALQDPAPALQYRAMESLAAVTGKNLGHDAGEWQQFLQSGGAAQTATRSTPWQPWK